MERFGPFMLVRTLGRGGMGEVFVARTQWPNAPVVAIKRVRRDLNFNARIPPRFEHEAQLAVRLAHAHVVPTIDVGSVDDEVYVASELILGKDAGAIGDRLRERAQGVPFGVALRVLADVLSALAYVHGAREPDGRWLALVHRDVTPGNVLIGYDGIARLADFGLARSALTEGKELTGQNELIGTPHYLPPEILAGNRAERPADIYGLGIVLYRLLTGSAPLEGLPIKSLFLKAQEKAPPLRDLRPDLPPWFCNVIHEMLEPDVSRRPSDAWLLGKRLEHQAANVKLLPRSAVGRWLSSLFEREHQSEIEEQARLVTIDRMEDDEIDAGPAAVIFAHADQSQSLVNSGPIPGKNDPSESGTQIDLSRAELLANAAEDTSISADEPVPSPSVSRSELVAPLSPDTRITQPPSNGASQPLVSQSETELDLKAPSLPQLKGKRTLPDSEYAHEPVVRPLKDDPLVPEIVIPSSAPPPAPARQATVGAPRSVKERFSLPVQTEPDSPHETPKPRIVASPVAPPRDAPPRFERRSLLGAVGAGFLVTGIGIAVGVWLYDRTAPEPLDERQLLVARFELIREEIAARNAAQRPVPARAAQLVADAASALFAGDAERARVAIDELERLLSAPAPGATH